MQHEALLLQGPVDARVPVHARRLGLRLARIAAVRGPGVLAGLLGLVHRRIGAGDELVLVLRVVGVGRDADAAAHAQALRRGCETQRRHGLDQPRRDRLRIAALDARAQHREFVAAEPRDEFAAPHLASQRARHRGQDLVAGAVAADVVGVLEVVEVDEQQRQRRARDRGVRDRGLQRFVEAAPVQQLGQRIVQRLLGALLRLALQRDVVVEPDAAALGHALHDRLHALRDQPAGQRAQLAQRGAAVDGRAVLQRRVEDERVVGLGLPLQQRQDLAQRPAARRLAQRPDALERAVGIDDASIAIDEQDAAVHRAEQRGQARLLFARRVEVQPLLRFAVLQRDDALLQRRGHRVEAGPQAPDLVVRGHRDVHIQIAAGDALARIGEPREVARDRVRDRRQHRDRQHQRRRADAQAAPQEVGARLAQLHRRQAEIDVAELLAGDHHRHSDVHAGVGAIQVDVVAVARRQRPRGIPAGVGDDAAAVIPQHEVLYRRRIAAHQVQRLLQRGVVALRERRGDRLVEQRDDPLRLGARLLDQRALQLPRAGQHQQRGRRDLHQHAGDDQLAAERAGGPDHRVVLRSAPRQPSASTLRVAST